MRHAQNLATKGMPFLESMLACMVSWVCALLFVLPSAWCVTNKATAATMPGINSLLGMIRSRRRRDAFIMGMVLGLGFVVILMYHWG